MTSNTSGGNYVSLNENTYVFSRNLQHNNTENDNLTLNTNVMIQELKDTTELMCSEDYKERFKAEYWQTKIRHDKLKRMYDNWDNLDFTPTCPKEIYDIQLKAMHDYLNLLEVRAKLESVEL